MDDSSIAGNTCIEEVLKTDKIDVPKHDLVFGLPHQQAAIHRAVFLQQGLCTLLELLRADFFRTHSLWYDEGAPRYFSETFCKNLCVNDVAFNDLEMVVFPKRRVHFTWVNLL